jgi:hypothetical protein
MANQASRTTEFKDGLPLNAKRSSFDAAPDHALRAIAAHRGSLLVDLDETLYLRNSTADFISHACPAPLAFLLMKLLDLLAPWRLTGGLPTRDNWRVISLLLLMPWTLLTWRHQAARLAAQWTNHPLLNALRASSDPKAIVTLGFGPVVSPLVAAMSPGEVRLLSMNVWRFHQRCEGKRAVALRTLGEVACQGALFVTDSLDDLDLLQACAQPLRVVWPGAHCRALFSDAYIPGLYTARVKHPGQNYIQRSILREDFMLWVLATIALASSPFVAHLAGLALLALSFWAIYETGYVDNDRIAAQFEKTPLSDAYFENTVRSSTVLPWVWACFAGVGGIVLLRWPAPPSPIDFLEWAALLALTFSIFRLYNRVDKQSRVWLFGVLQMLRAAAVAAIAPISLAGALGLTAHGLARWVPYFIYRCTGTWRKEVAGRIRLLFFVLPTVVCVNAFGWSLTETVTTLAILIWFAFKARHELRSALRAASPISQDRHPVIGPDLIAAREATSTAEARVGPKLPATPGGG